MYSNFYKIPLPALRFEKVEETDTKSEKWKNDTEEKQPLPNSTTSENRKKTTLKEKQIHSQENDMQRRLKNASWTKAFVIREIKLTYSKNGRH